MSTSEVLVSTELYLYDAHLQHAKLTGTSSGLFVSVFAGTDLTAALLTRSIAKFDGLAHVQELSKINLAPFKPLQELCYEPGTLIESGSSWQNGFNKSFNSKLRDELLKGEISIRSKLFKC
jgi:hypothetical protein